MNVNPGSRPPVTLDERAAAILATLHVPHADPEDRRRLRTFIQCNGYRSVLDAARYTASQAKKETIDNPWAYTIQVYNGNLARLSYLYGLIHWAEAGLRSQLDAHYVPLFGATWHVSPEKYLSINSVNQFLEAHKPFGHITAREVRGGAGAIVRKEIVTPATPSEFLEHVTTGWLVSMVRYLHDRSRSRAILVQPNGDQTSPQEAGLFYQQLKDARNAVAHNNYMSNEEFTKYQATLLTLLGVLHFDVAKALGRVEEIRATLVSETIKRLTQ